MRRAGTAVAAFLLLLTPPAFGTTKIRHKPPAASAGSDLIIHASIKASGGVLEATVNYRKKRGDFAHTPLAPQGHDEFEAKIPASYLSNATHLEYFIRAVAAKDLTETTWKSKSSPYKLKVEKAGQKLHVTTSPSGASLELDGDDAGTAPLTKNVTPGKHHLTAALKGFPKLDRDFTMPGDHGLDLPLTLSAELGPRPITRGMGRLRLISVPPGAKITADGDAQGTTPLEVDLPPNSYLVNATLDGYQSESRVVKLAEGQTAERVIRLRASMKK
jgi:hypothetical protein